MGAKRKPRNNSSACLRGISSSDGLKQTLKILGPAGEITGYEKHMESVPGRNIPFKPVNSH